MNRVLVVGMSGAGKTTAARQVAAAIGAPAYEMDALMIGPGWSTPPDAVARVEAVLTGDRWVIDSWGYPEVRDLMWRAADTVVWLDYPRRVVLPRLVRRSLARSLHREPLFGGNVERWRDWLGPHPVWHAVRTFGARRRYLRDRIAAEGHLTAVRCTRPAELDAWVAGLPAAG